MYVEISTISRIQIYVTLCRHPECGCFGVNRQNVALKLLLAFRLWPPKHLWSKSSLEKAIV